MIMIMIALLAARQGSVREDQGLRFKLARAAHTVSPHDFDSQHFDQRVANPISEYMESCGKPQEAQHLSQDMYACNHLKI